MMRVSRRFTFRGTFLQQLFSFLLPSSLLSTIGLKRTYTGLVDRDFGPKADMEDAMAAFLNDFIYAEEPNATLPDAVDAGQWLKTLATYAVTVNMDSPLNNLNNWCVRACVRDCVAACVG